MKKTCLSLPIFLMAVTAFAQFEGTVEMKMTMTDKEGASEEAGKMKLAVGKPGVRTEMNMQVSGMAMNMVMLFKNDNPDVMYRINDAGKSYSEVDLAKMRSMAAQYQGDEKVTVKKLGEEKILGYKTVHVLVTQPHGTTELWTAKDFIDYATFSKFRTGPGGRGPGESMFKALKEAGADGMPLKSITAGPNGGTMTMEVVKADKQSLPASTFEIPAGYTKSSGGMTDMMGGMSGQQSDEMKAKMDAARQKMNDAMKNMSPEQREMMEKMMKQHGVSQ